MKRLKRTFAGLVFCTRVVSSYIAWSGFTGREPVPIPRVLSGGPSSVTGTDSGFDDLEVSTTDDGRFDETISVENPTDAFQDVMVTVDLFDGDQNVGELVGSVTIKPGTASSMKLISPTPYVEWSDAHVDLLRLP